MSQNRLWVGILAIVLGAMFWFSAHLAVTRIYQVDECQNLYMARILASGQGSEFFTSSSLFLLGPLSWISKNAVSSAQAFASARCFFLGVFWVNLLLLASIAGQRLFSTRGLIALTAAATLAPLWDYGFEIRHDNVVLTGILLTWWAVRTKPLGVPAYLLAGALAFTLLFVAVKTVVYVVPLSLAILAFPPPAHKRPRWQLALAWAGGALCAAALIRVCYGSGTAWNNYLSVFHLAARDSANDGGSTSFRFWPWSTLGRLPGQTPLLLALTVAACFAAVADLARRRITALNWNGILPEVLLLLGALAALIVNPTPYPYNLVLVVPFAFILVFKFATGIGSELQDRASRANLLPFAGALLAFAHVIPFAVATARHLNRSNTRQQELMRLAEELTDPAKDRVYDATGLVATRRSIHFQWYIHSLNLRAIVNTPGSRVRDMLAAQPAAVFIPSYRTAWLPAEDHDFIRTRYVPLADDFWVLGTVLPPGGGTFEIVHAGRYHIVTSPDSGAYGACPGDKTITGTLDGVALPATAIELNTGAHRIETTPDCRPAVVWVGPNLDRIDPVAAGNSRTLFANWY